MSQVLDYYERCGRHTLPWRLTQDPYRILVSELMLQQTQVERVIPKYETFIHRWPTTKTLARASLGDIIIAWQGLGYNRRAKFLHECAIAIENNHHGVFPKTEEELRLLPGIGPYTASAVCAFAYNQPVILIETNVRRVFIHHFFPDKELVTDSQILPIVERTLPKDHSRRWYGALMDYGTYIKKQFGNANTRSRQYKRQAPFVGSDRQIRGAILRELSSGKRTRIQLKKLLHEFSSTRVDSQLEKLCQEGLVGNSGKHLLLPV